MIPRPLVPALLAALLAARGCAADDDDPTITSSSVVAEPIYLPYWGKDDWALVRGSILGSDAAAGETTYTIFCPTQTPPACDLSLEFPFVIVEGKDTVAFHGTYTSTYIADVACRLNGTTAATCSGYSSYKSGYTNAFHTGPTQISWTKTLSGSDVQWGSLTLAPAPTTTDDSLDITATAMNTPASGVSVSLPTDGSQGAAASLRVDRQWLCVAAAAAGFAALMVL